MCERALALKEGGKRAAGTFISGGWVRGALPRTRTRTRAAAQSHSRSADLCQSFFPSDGSQSLRVCAAVRVLSLMLVLSFVS